MVRSLAVISPFNFRSNPQDVAEFVGRLEAVLPDSDAVVQCYEDECLLQADRLPLVQSVS